jgi:hypothetical protein
MILLQILGWIILPVFISSAVSTLTEFMIKRFDGNRILNLMKHFNVIVWMNLVLIGDQVLNKLVIISIEKKKKEL